MVGGLTGRRITGEAAAGLEKLRVGRGKAVEDGLGTAGVTGRRVGVGVGAGLVIVRLGGGEGAAGLVFHRSVDDRDGEGRVIQRDGVAGVAGAGVGRADEEDDDLRMIRLGGIAGVVDRGVGRTDGAAEGVERRIVRVGSSRELDGVGIERADREEDDLRMIRLGGIAGVIGLGVGRADREGVVTVGVDDRGKMNVRLVRSPPDRVGEILRIGEAGAPLRVAQEARFERAGEATGVGIGRIMLRAGEADRAGAADGGITLTVLAGAAAVRAVWRISALRPSVRRGEATVAARRLPAVRTGTGRAATRPGRVPTGTSWTAGPAPPGICQARFATARAARLEGTIGRASG